MGAEETVHLQVNVSMECAAGGLTAAGGFCESGAAGGPTEAKGTDSTWLAAA